MDNFLRQAAQSFSFNSGAKEINRICLPFLNEWKFANFYYVRITKKGQLLYLTNRVDFAFNYWEAALPLRTGFTATFEEQLNYALLWKGSIDKSIVDFAATHGCFDGLSFIDRYHDTIQFATFLRTSQTDDANQFYFRNLDRLRCWLREFEWKNRRLIKQALENPLLLPEHYLMPQKEAFYPSRTVKFKSHNIQAKLSFRELDCLHLRSKGFTCQLVAQLLGLSQRTVETHLESIKNRFGLSTQDDLAQLAYSNSTVQNYCPRTSLKKF